MKTRTVAVCLILAWLQISLGFAQQPGLTLKPQNNQAAQRAIGEAIKSDRFVLGDNGAEYKLEKPVKIPSSTSGTRNVAVEYEIGTIENKPAVVTVIGDEKTLPQKSSEVDSLFSALNTKDVRSRSFDAQIQMCTGDRVCVETKKVDGKQVCVKWKCS